MLDIKSIEDLNLKNLSSLLKKVKLSSIKGLVGLNNLGNTCYMNSVLQVLNQCLPLTIFMTFLKHYKLNMSVPENKLINHYQVLSDNMWNSDVYLTPIDFVDCFFSIFTCFEPGRKQDSQEFLRFLFDAFHKALSSFTNIISNVFSGKLERKIVCHNCGGVLTGVDEFYDLSLPVPSDENIENYSEKSISLMSEADRIKFESCNRGIFSMIKNCISGQSLSLFDGLVSFFEPTEMKEEGNLFHCTPCDGKYFSTLSYSIKELPNILIFTIKRFKYLNNASRKISSHVELPLVIDLRPFCMNKDIPYEYELFGVIEHIGSFGRGHYKAYIKNKAFGKWFEMNDSKVSVISEKSLLSKQVYIAFYSVKFCEREFPIQSGDVFITREWVLLYETITNPGPILTEHLLCKHGQLARWVTPEVFIQTTREIYEAMRKQFGGDSEIIGNTEACALCEEEVSKLEEEILRERESVADIRINNRPGGFIVAKGWYQKWTKYLEWDHEHIELPEHPGIINNRELFEKNELKMSLLRNIDYEVIGDELWSMILSIYSTTNVMHTETGNIYDFGSPALELQEPVKRNQDNSLE